MSEIFPEFNGSISSILRTNYKQLNEDGEVTYWDISIWSTEDIYYTYRFNVHFNANWTHISSDDNHPHHLNVFVPNVLQGKLHLVGKLGHVRAHARALVQVQLVRRVVPDQILILLRLLGLLFEGVHRGRPQQTLRLLAQLHRL